MEFPCSIETKPIVFFNDDDKERIHKNRMNCKGKPMQLSDTSLSREDEDDNCSSSATLSTEALIETECSVSISSSCEFGKSLLDDGYNVAHPTHCVSSFMSLRLKYLSVTLVVMLADGLQGGLLWQKTNIFRICML